ncbi:MAG TPA: fluoride efflux transporter CrcB [Mariniphaga sp.]|nr:fluoride efflux transporter CrcB [Mariniphaga sp.]
MLRTILIVGSGGFIGSVMRYMVQYLMERTLTSLFPWGTLIANVAGSFIIGIVFALAEKGNLLSAEWRLFMAVGICGGFTTFSSFAYNNFMMIREKAFVDLFLNVGGSLFLGIAAVYLGIILIRMIY